MSGKICFLFKSLFIGNSPLNSLPWSILKNGLTTQHTIGPLHSDLVVFIENAAFVNFLGEWGYILKKKHNQPMLYYFQKGVFGIL